MKKYSYDGKTYFSEKALRNAIFEKERKAFGKAPAENVAEFWKKHNVVYETHEPSLDSLKAEKKAHVKFQFNLWQNLAKLTSSLGFEIDANAKARNSIDDLIETLQGDEKVCFRDAHNEYHEVTVEQLRTLKSEIAKNNIYAHEQKWQFEQQVANASSREELKAIRVVFVGKVFEGE